MILRVLRQWFGAIFAIESSAPETYVTPDAPKPRSVIPISAQDLAEDAAPTSQGKFARGEGTAESPYEVSNDAEFRLIANYPKSYFRITKDILLWRPITPIEVFEGVIFCAGFEVEEFLSFDCWIKVNRGDICGVNFRDPKLRGGEDVSRVGLILKNEGNIIDCKVKGGSFHSLWESREGIIAGWVVENAGLVAKTEFSGEIYSIGSSIGGIVGLNLPQAVMNECGVGGGLTQMVCHAGEAVGGVTLENRGVMFKCSSSGYIMLLSYSTGQAGGVVARQIADAINYLGGSSCDLEVKSSQLKCLGGVIGTNAGIFRDAFFIGRISARVGLAQVGLLVGDQREVATFELGAAFEAVRKKFFSDMTEASRGEIPLIGEIPLVEQIGLDRGTGSSIPN